LEQTVTLQIFGRKFTFQTESGVPDAKKVAALFDDAVQKVQSQFDGKPVNVDRETILVLTGLNIASEHFKREERTTNFVTV
jgi:cell division protein ZapA (FtsZ GTPase activity inhibitor)